MASRFPVGLRALVSGLNRVPNLLVLEDLLPAEGAEAARLRFSDKEGRKLDLRVTAEGLSLLERTMRHLEGVPPEEIPHKLAELFEKKVLPLNRT